MQIQLTGNGIFQKIQVLPRAPNGTGKTPIVANFQAIKNLKIQLKLKIII